MKIYKEKRRIIFYIFIFFSSILFLFLFFQKKEEAAFENKSRYWSNSKSGPVTTNEAIDKLFKNRKELDPLEGIWSQEDYKIIAIVKSQELNKSPILYSKYIITNKKNPSENGTMEGSFHRTKFSNSFIAFEKFKFSDLESKKDDRFFTATGMLVLTNNDNAKVIINNSKNFKNLNKNYNLIKIYPKNKSE